MKQTKKRFRQKAQSVVEYLVLVAAVIVLLLIVFRSGGPFTRIYHNVIQQQGDDMLNAAVKIF